MEIWLVCADLIGGVSLEAKAFVEMPLQAFLSLRPEFLEFFPASVFPPSDPYMVRLAPRSDGGLLVEVGYSDDNWCLGFGG